MYVIIRGYLMLKTGKPYFSITMRINLWLLRVLYGAEAANRRKSEIASPQRVRSLGKQLLVMGLVLLLVPILTMMGD